MPHRYRVATIALIGALLIGCGSTRDEPAPDIILITLDTQRADRLGCYGDKEARTPWIDRLARDGVVFENAAATAPITLPSHASIMTGRYPAAHGVRDNTGFVLPDREVTLAEELQRAGYRTAAFIGGAPLARRFGLSQGFETYDDRFGMGAGSPRAERPAAAVTDAALAWLREHATDAPVFLWLHYFDPHAEYQPPPPFDQMRDRYRGEVAYVDQELARFVDEFVASRGRSPLTVLTADHGEALGDHGETSHGLFLYEAVMRVPLIFHWQGRVTARRIDTVVSLVDIAPTLLALLGEEPSAELQGVDLASSIEHGAPVPARPGVLLEAMMPHYSFGWAEVPAIRDTHWKLIDGPRPELYRLDTDPHELLNLLAAEPERAERMRDAMHGALRSLPQSADATAPIDPETLETLRSLGYLGGSDVAAIARDQSRDGPRADPKDRLQEYNIWLEANRLVLLDQKPEAVVLMERLLARDPTNPYVRMQLAWQRALADDLTGARELYEQLLTDQRYACRAHYGLAMISERVATDLETVIERFRVAVDCDPNNADARWRLSRLAERAGDAATALAQMEGAVANEPYALEYRRRLAALYVRADRPRDVERVWQELVSLDPSAAVAHNSLGVLYLHQKNTAMAHASFERALAAQPNDVDANANLGSMLLRAGRYAESVARLRAAIDLAPRNDPVRLDLALALLESGDPAAARRQVDQLEAPGAALQPRLEVLERGFRSAARAADADAVRALLSDR